MWNALQASGLASSLALSGTQFRTTPLHNIKCTGNRYHRKMRLFTSYISSAHGINVTFTWHEQSGQNRRKGLPRGKGDIARDAHERASNVTSLPGQKQWLTFFSEKHQYFHSVFRPTRADALLAMASRYPGGLDVLQDCHGGLVCHHPDFRFPTFRTSDFRIQLRDSAVNNEVILKRFAKIIDASMDEHLELRSLTQLPVSGFRNRGLSKVVNFRRLGFPASDFRRRGS